MRVWNICGAVLVLSVISLRASAQTPSMDEMVDRIVTQEKAEMQMLRQYSPLVETYIQTLRADAKLGPIPAGDRYFLGKAELANGVDLEPFASDGREAVRIVEELFDAVVVALRRDPRFAGILLREFDQIFADVRADAEQRLFDQLIDRVHLDDVADGDEQ